MVPPTDKLRSSRMSTKLVIRDLNVSEALDRKAAKKVFGGGRPTGGQKPKEGETRFWSWAVWYFEVDKETIIT
jgi:hypothetical protein